MTLDPINPMKKAVSVWVVIGFCFVTQKALV